MSVQGSEADTTFCLDEYYELRKKHLLLTNSNANVWQLNMCDFMVDKDQYHQPPDMER